MWWSISLQRGAHTVSAKNTDEALPFHPAATVRHAWSSQSLAPGSHLGFMLPRRLSALILLGEWLPGTRLSGNWVWSMAATGWNGLATGMPGLGGPWSNAYLLVCPIVLCGAFSQESMDKVVAQAMRLRQRRKNLCLLASERNLCRQACTKSSTLGMLDHIHPLAPGDAPATLWGSLDLH